MENYSTVNTLPLVSLLTQVSVASIQQYLNASLIWKCMCAYLKNKILTPVVFRLSVQMVLSKICTTITGLIQLWKILFHWCYKKKSHGWYVFINSTTLGLFVYHLFHATCLNSCYSQWGSYWCSEQKLERCSSKHFFHWRQLNQGPGDPSSQDLHLL